MKKLSDNILLNDKSLRNKGKKSKRDKKKTKRVKKKTKGVKKKTKGVKKKKKQKGLSGGNDSRGNECMYVRFNAPGFRNRRERTQDECIRKPGCSWGIKLSPYHPIRGKSNRCYKTH